MRKVLFWSLCIYLYVCVCVFVCYSQNSKSIKPNRMTFGGMIGYYAGTIWFDFGIDRVKGQGHEKVPKKWLRRRYALYRVPVLVWSCFLFPPSPLLWLHLSMHASWVLSRQFCFTEAGHPNLLWHISESLFPLFFSPHCFHSIASLKQLTLTHSPLSSECKKSCRMFLSVPKV